MFFVPYLRKPVIGLRVESRTDLPLRLNARLNQRLYMCVSTADRGRDLLKEIDKVG